mgnify:CR=1 FL=1
MGSNQGLIVLLLAKTTKCIAPVTSINMCSLNLIFIDDNYLLAPSGRRIRKPVRYRADYHETDNVVDDDAPGYYIDYRTLYKPICIKLVFDISFLNCFISYLILTSLVTL